jgi:hypothetical protein
VRVQVGDRVRVIGGSYAGEVGMVLQTQDDDQCIVISEATKQEVKAFGRCGHKVATVDFWCGWCSAGHWLQAWADGLGSELWVAFCWVLVAGVG